MLDNVVEKDLLSDSPSSSSFASSSSSSSSSSFGRDSFRSFTTTSTYSRGSTSVSSSYPEKAIGCTKLYLQMMAMSWSIVRMTIRR